jgi:ABC-type branched-subunit amino acid transport system ATPase component/ABC-type branched-subunit amino acid transport system permease subunit
VRTATWLGRAGYLGAVAAAGVLLATALAVPNARWLSGYLAYLLTLAAVYTIIAVGLDLLVGHGDQISLGHAGFYALGAYTAAILVARLGWSLWLTLPLALAVAALAGALLALPTLRLEGLYLAMATIAFGLVVQNVLIEWLPLTGGHNGIAGIARPVVGGRPLGDTAYCLVVVAAALLALAFGAWAVRSLWGRSYRAVCLAPTASAAVGLDGYRLRVGAFALSAALAGLAGALYAGVNSFVSPDSFGFDTSISFLTAVILGGRGTLLGPVLGAATLVFLPDLLAGLAEYRLLLFGALLLFCIYFLPRGIAGLVLTLAARLRPGSAARPAPALAAEDATAPPAVPRPAASDGAALAERSGADRWAAEGERGRADAPLLEGRDLTVAFGGFLALRGVDFVVHRGTVHGLIGPNGAGKTTLLNVLGGFQPVVRGQLRFAGRDILGLPPHAVARLGVARTFQHIDLLREEAVLANVESGAWQRFGGGARGLLPLVGARAARQARAVALDCLAFVGLAVDPRTPAGALPPGQQRLVELARALATAPRLLLLDEPAAGLTPAEVERLGELVRHIRARGITVVLIEHHVDFVLTCADRVTVLDYGEWIAEGPPEQVRRDPRVIAAYLGESGGEPGGAAVAAEHA